MEYIYCTVGNDGKNLTPYYLLSKGINRCFGFVVGVTCNMVLMVIDDSNRLVSESSAPEELRKYANIVKDFKRDPLWELKMRRYFGKPQIHADNCI